MTARTATRELDRAALWRDLGYRPHPGQELVHSSTATRRALACGRRWGKTVAAAMECVAAALEPGPTRAVGWIVAANYELSRRVFDEVALAFMRHLPHRVVVSRPHEHLLEVVNADGSGTCEVRGKSADAPVSLLGQGLDWLVIDEAAQLRPDTWQKYLSPALVDRQGWALLISTPKGKGWFYDYFRRGQSHVHSEYESWASPSWENPHLDRATVEAERERVPEAVFRQEYGAEFLEGAGQVFRHVRDLATRAPEPPRASETYCAGLDLARVQDYTVMIVLDSARNVVAWERFTRVDWAAQVARVAELAKRYNDAFVLVDSTGAGEPVYERLLEAGVRIDGYPFTAASKAALVNNLAMLLESHAVGLPTAQAFPELVDELEAFEFSVTDAGNVKTGSPSGMHDDCVCALMLAAWAARDPGEFEVQWV